MLKGILTASMTFLVLSLGCQSIPDKVLAEPNGQAIPTVIAGQQDQDIAYKVRVELVFSEADVKAYPELFQAFIGALQEWANVIPVEAIMMVPEKGSTVTTEDLRRERYGIAMVNFTHNIPSKDKQNNLGVWFSNVRVINLDLDDMYPNDIFDVDMARAVSLHELGHMFGLPHIGNRGELDIKVGDLTVASGAESMLMHLEIPSDLKHVAISKMEMEYARRYLLTVFSDQVQNF